MSRIADPDLWGVVAEFDSAEALLQAAIRAREAGHAGLQAYTPFEIEGLADAVGFPRSRIPAITLVAAILGGAGGYFMQWYAAVVSFPINIGGRPAHSWPMFIPVAFEMTILCGSLAAVVAFLVGSRLPSLHHPVFDAPGFVRATRDRFFLALPAAAEGFDRQAARRTLQGLQPLSCHEVAR